MKQTVIYHRADFDGIFCREIAKKFLPNAELIGWDYGDKRLPFPEHGKVYVLDLSPECFGVPGFTQHEWERLEWIDHHKSAIEKWPKEIPGYRIDGVAACRLAWQWFNNPLDGTLPLPFKEQFLNREVSEPLAVMLAGEYDIWDKRDPRAELFQHGLRSRDLTVWWDAMLGDEGHSTIAEIEELISAGKKVELLPNGRVRMPGLGERVVANLLKRGEVIQYAREREYEEVIKEQGFTVTWEGLTFLCCNSHELDIRSHLFAAGIKPEHHALLGFTFNGADWRVSMYGVPGKPDIDLSVIAVKYGGGGHKQACGFRTKTLPFL